MPMLTVSPVSVVAAHTVFGARTRKKTLQGPVDDAMGKLTELDRRVLRKLAELAGQPIKTSSGYWANILGPIVKETPVFASQLMRHFSKEEVDQSLPALQGAHLINVVADGLGNTLYMRENGRRYLACLDQAQAQSPEAPPV